MGTGGAGSKGEEGSGRQKWSSGLFPVLEAQRLRLSVLRSLFQMLVTCLT